MFKCSLNDPWMFPECSNVHSTIPECSWMCKHSLNDPWMFPECSNVHSTMFPKRCSLNDVPWMFPKCSNVHSTIPECSLNVLWMCKHSLNNPWMFPLNKCSPNVHMFTQRSMNVSWMFPECSLLYQEVLQAPAIPQHLLCMMTAVMVTLKTRKLE
jgi:hypothetical protein